MSESMLRGGAEGDGFSAAAAAADADDADDPWEGGSSGSSGSSSSNEPPFEAGFDGMGRGAVDGMCFVPGGHVSDDRCASFDGIFVGDGTMNFQEEKREK
jgi:hypothetical protein